MSARPIRVCYPFVGEELGGSHFSALGMISGVDPRRYETRVVLQNSHGPVFDFFRASNVPIEEAPPSPSLRRGQRAGAGDFVSLALSAPRLARFLKEMSCDIVHCNDGRSSATWALAAKMAGAKVVWHNRGNPRALGLRVVAPLLADTVVSVSEFASPRPGLLSAAAKNHVVFSPFDTSVVEDRAAARALLVDETGASPDAIFVGYFGALVARKRPVLFVDVIAELRRRAPDMNFIGVMFGAPRDGLEVAVDNRAHELNVEAFVRRMGFRTPGSRWLAACDVLLVPAIEEPLGRTLIEAMLLGTPVVATRSGGNPEAIRHGETGWLAPPEDAPALAAMTMGALASPDREAVLRRAAQTAKERFGEERHVEAIMSIYDSLVERGVGRRVGHAGRVAA